MIIKRISLVILYCGLFVFLLLTNPTSLPIAFLVVPFIWVYLAIFFACYYFIRRVVGWILQRSLNRRKSLAIASLFAFVPTSILILKSIDQLTLRDIAIVSILGLIMAFYVSRLTFIKSTV